MSGSEQRGFIFSVVFIIIFAGLLSTVPLGLRGAASDISNITPLDPSILTDFVDGENYTKSAFSGVGLLGYEYELGGKFWICATDEIYFVLSAKVLIFGILWLGHLDSCYFISEDGVDRGNKLYLTEIDADAEDGTARYTLTHVISGASAGGFVVYWNTTEYSNSKDAWDDDKLYLLHGIGLESTATNDIGALLIQLLFLQLPQVPALINLFIVVPVWASIIYVIWFIVKEMIPFI